eukprot:30268_1
MQSFNNFITIWIYCFSLIFSSIIDNRTHNCFYHSAESYRISESQSIIESIHFNDTAIQIEFDILLNDYCNSLSCNIFDLTNNNFDESISLSLNINQSVIISFFNNYTLTSPESIPADGTLLSLDADGKYHHIYMLISFDHAAENVIIIDKLSWYFPPWHFIRIINESYTFYLSGPWENAINGSVRNICLRSSTAIQITNDWQLSCGETISNVLLWDNIIHKYHFVTNDSYSVTIDDCYSPNEITTKVYDMEGIFISNPYCEGGDYCGYCNHAHEDNYNWHQNFTMPLDNGEYFIQITTRTLAYRYTFSIYCVPLDIRYLSNTSDFCNYYSNNTYSIASSNIVFNDVLIRHSSIEIEFDIKLNKYCNESLCNIFYIGDHKYFRFLSLSINGNNNTFEITATYNYFFRNVFEISNASQLLPVDHEYHKLYVSYVSEYSNQAARLRIDDISHYRSKPWFSSFPTVINLPFYMVSPWHNGLNATIKDICIKSQEEGPSNTPCPICDGEIQCNQTLWGDIAFPTDMSYYYFNTTERKPNIVFDSCGSGFFTRLYLYDLDWNLLYKDIGDGLCGYAATLTIFSLDAGEYILGIGGDGFTADYGHWTLDVDCRGFINSTYVLNVDNPYFYQDWFLQEATCEQQFGTSLATVITDQDIMDAKKLIHHEEIENYRVWVGLYKDITASSKWQWVTGMPCDYVSTEDCADDPHWSTTEPNYETSFDQTQAGAYLLIKDSIRFYDDSVDGTARVYSERSGLCNAPNGKYRVRNCTYIDGCWHTFGNSNDSILIFDTAYDVDIFQPPFAYWNSQLFVVGLNEIHYKKVTLFNDTRFEWYDKLYNNYTYNTSIVTQRYTQYQSSFYLHALDHNRIDDTLIHINLDNLNVEYFEIPQMYNWLNDPVVDDDDVTKYCMVSTQNQVFIIRSGSILIYNIQNKSWENVAKSRTTPLTCAITKDQKFIYMFGGHYFTSDTGARSIRRFNIELKTFLFLDTVSLCHTRFARAITGNNGKIYLHGCYMGSWKTLIFDPVIEQFEIATINIGNPITRNIPYYTESQLSIIDDNVLLLGHTIDYKYPIFYDGEKYESVSWYYAVTELISINFEQTISDESIWPSDGVYIKYYINDFNSERQGVYHLIFSNTIKHINTSIILNS